ncbi:arylsulfotransferase family protein [Halosimplex marinum]|uniref:arylsulfotransferase family protein n=1 Tax=Halosimplex marinum TaxID=3396620 RepID=UPI003F54CEE4
MGVLVLALAVSAVAGYVQASDGVTKSELREQAQLPMDERDEIVDDRDNMTVVTTSPRESAPGKIMAFTPDGRLAYYNDTYKKYFDVDPAPGGDATVEYVAGSELGRKGCPASGIDPCSRIVIERVNLTTGELTQLHERIVPGWSIWHDADRLDEHRFLIADIAGDSVFVMNVTSGITTWRWDAETDYSVRSGGQMSDWTHLNDVERVGEGRYMVSLRNQDQVAFLNRSGGVIEDWTLGADGNHSVLYEQHNPDFIPAERGGPAVVVSDSENNRLVEYQRTNGSWERTWHWADAQMQWPRDADRLPDGNTLVADSNGNRIFELNQRGEIVWEVQVDTPYEVERLGTGPESTGGHSAQALGLDSRGDAGSAAADEPRERNRTGLFEGVVGFFKGLLPSLVVNGLLFVMPVWMNAQIFLSLVGALLVLAVWAALELYWSRWYVAVDAGRKG